MPRRAALALIAWAAAVHVRASDCPPLPPPSGPVINVAPAQAGQLSDIVGAAASGTTIRLADGFYALNGASLAFRNAGVTLRSASGNRSAVVLDGNYQGGSILSVAASNVTIADLTVQRAWFHPIHVASFGGNHVTGTLIHNVRVIDPGQQAIKINNNGSWYADSGTIRCSHIELTAAGRGNVRDNCYTGGVDAHQALGWQVRDNTIVGFWCPAGLSEHAIHFWRGSRDTLAERNQVVNCARGFGFGLGLGVAGRTYGDDPCPGVPTVGHFGGLIRNNTVFAHDAGLFGSEFGFDTGIALEQACVVRVLHNTVFSTQAPFSSIEWRFSGTSATLTNNLVSHGLVPRDGASATLAGNLQNAPAALFANAAGGDLHLAASALTAIDQGVPIGGQLAAEDMDRQVRDAAPDRGADEHRPRSAVRHDFDGDGRADLAVYHPPSGLWYLRSSANGSTTTVGHGGPAYTPVAGDYDGDALTDVAVYHEASGLWFLRLSGSGSTQTFGYGGSGFLPVARDYDGDGRTDLGVYHPASGLWNWRSSSSGATTTVGFGGSGYTPVPQDLDGEGKSDLAVYHPPSGLWFVRSSLSGATSTTGFGGSAYTPVPGSFDGDSRADIAVYHASSGLWTVRDSATSAVSSVAWGGSAFTPVAADYDGDGRADLAVYHEGTGQWTLRLSSVLAASSVLFGGSGFVPIVP